MKFSVSMKAPDALYESISDAVDSELEDQTFDDEERDAVRELRVEKLTKLCGKWFEYGEYLCVEIDTEAMTCAVRPVGA